MQTVYCHVVVCPANIPNNTLGAKTINFHLWQITHKARSATHRVSHILVATLAHPFVFRNRRPSTYIISVCSPTLNLWCMSLGWAELGEEEASYTEVSYICANCLILWFHFIDDDNGRGRGDNEGGLGWNGSCALIFN